MDLDQLEVMIRQAMINNDWDYVAVLEALMDAAEVATQ